MELKDSKHLKIEGQGVIIVNTNGGNKRHIYDIYYSSKITHNLLSVGQMMKKGYKPIFDNDQYEIFDKKNNQKLTAMKMNANYLFPLDMLKL